MLQRSMLQSFLLSISHYGMIIKMFEIYKLGVKDFKRKRLKFVKILSKCCLRIGSRDFKNMIKCILGVFIYKWEYV